MRKFVLCSLYSVLSSLFSPPYFTSTFFWSMILMPL